MRRTMPFSDDEVKMYAFAEIRVYSGPSTSLVVGDIRELPAVNAYVKYHEEMMVSSVEEEDAIKFFEERIKSQLPDPERTIPVYDHGDLGKKLRT